VKKALLLVSALLIVFSGVAAVSAYEGHLVNIKAHVENAIGVETYEFDLGTYFPQERVQNELGIGLSESFIAQDRVSTVEYKLCWELKPIPADQTDNVCDPDGDGYYTPLNPYLEITMDDANDNIDPSMIHGVPADNTTAVCFGTGQMWKSRVPGEGDVCDIIHVIFSAPVFEGYYNDITDDPPDGWVYGMIMEGNYCTANETICDGAIDVKVPHADLGIDLKIQVTSIVQD
jgi:hypothetical protein